MAQTMVIRVVGDASAYFQTLRQVATGTNKFTKEAERAGRGALAGSGLFRSMGRSIAFASGAFIGFSSASKFLVDSIKATQEARVAQRSLAAQMKTSGESFRDYRDRIEQAAVGFEKLGFNSDQYVQSLTVLVRGTRNINQAMKLQGLAADIARAKNIDLSAAANIVAKVFGHQETALRRAVPGLAKNAHGWDLIRQAQQRMAGQAQAGTTVTEQFNATLHNTEVILGTGLLPVLNKVLGQFTKWLDKMNRDPQTGKNLTKAGHDAEKAWGWLGDFVGILEKGTKFARELSSPKPVSLHQIAPNLFGGPPGRVTSAGMMRAGGGPDLGHPTPPPAVLYAPAGPQLMRYPAFQSWIQQLLTGAGYATPQQQIRDYDRVIALLRARIAKTRDITRLKNLENQVLAVLASKKAAEQQLVTNAIDALQLGIDRAGLTAGLGDDLAALRKMEAYLKARIKVTKDASTLLQLESQLVSTQGQIQQARQQQAQQRQAARQAAQAARDARMFRQLGLDPTGNPLVPGVAVLKRRLESIRHAVAGTALGRRDAGLLGRIGDILFGEHPDAAVRSKINDIFDAIRQALNQGGSKVQGEMSKWAHTTNKKLLEGLGLTPKQRQELTQRLATVGPGGTVPPHHTAAFAGATVYTGDIHVHGVQDPGKFEDHMTRRQAARAHHRRGAR